MGLSLLFFIGWFLWSLPSGLLSKDTIKFRPLFKRSNLDGVSRFRIQWSLLVIKKRDFFILLVNLVINALSLWLSVKKSRLMGWFVSVDFYDSFLLVGSCWWAPIGWLLKQAAATWGLILQGQAPVSCFPIVSQTFQNLISVELNSEIQIQQIIITWGWWTGPWF